MHSGVATCAGGALTGVVHAGTGTTSIVTPSAIERWASAVPPVPCQLATQVLILVALSPTECFFCYLKKFPDSPSRSGTLSFAPPGNVAVVLLSSTAGSGRTAFCRLPLKTHECSTVGATVAAVDCALQAVLPCTWSWGQRYSLR